MAWNVIEYGPRRKLIEIWSNTDGFTVSNAGNVFLEAGGNGRGYLVQAGDYTSKGGTTVLGESQAANAVNNTVDMIRGGPALRTEHLFRIPVDGADRMFVEWRGECVEDSTGFALNLTAPPTHPYGPAYWWSQGSAWACGTFIDNPAATSSYLGQPQNVCYNSTQYGNQAAVLAGVSDATGENPWGLIGGMPLIVRSYQTVDTDISTGTPVLYKGTYSDQRSYSYRHTMAKLTHQASALSWLSQGGFIWGYSKTSAGGADQSRYPKAGDRYGWTYEIGYPRGHGAYNTTSGSPANAVRTVRGLSVSGLSAVYCAFYEIAPATGATEAARYLDLTTASMKIRGSLRVALISNRRST